MKLLNMYFVSPAGNLFRYVVTTGVEVGTWFTRRHGDSVVCIRTDIVRGKIQIHELITKGGEPARVLPQEQDPAASMF